MNTFGRTAAQTAGVALLGLSLASLATPSQAAHTRRAHHARPSGAHSTSQHITTFLRGFYDQVFNTGNMAAADKFVAPNYVEHTPFPGQPPTLAGLKKGFTQYRNAFPDIHFVVKDVIVQGDKAVARWTMTGTHKGAFMGIAPTGKKVTMEGVDIVRIVHGKAVEHWGYENDLSLMQQISPSPTKP